MHLDASRRRLFQQTLLLLGSSELLPGIPAKAIPATPDEMLPFYSTAIPACWSLIYSGGIKYVEKVLPSYIAHLINFVQQFPQHRKIAANFASQGLQIASMIALENEDYHSALSYIGDAISYAEFTQDVSIETAALMRKVTVLWYWKRYQEMHETLKMAENYTKNVSPLMQANIYSALSADIIIASSEQQKALRNIEVARELFPQNAEMDPIFSSTYITRYLLYFNENVAYMNLKRYKEAWNALEMADNYVSPVPSTRRMELLTHQISVAVALGDLERSDKKMREAIAMNDVLVSNLWFRTLKDIYEVLQSKWREEIKIKALGELLFYK